MRTTRSSAHSERVRRTLVPSLVLALALPMLSAPAARAGAGTIDARTQATTEAITSCNGVTYAAGCDTYPFFVTWCYKGDPTYGPLYTAMSLSADAPRSFNTVKITTESQTSCGWAQDQDLGTFSNVFVPPVLRLTSANPQGGLVKHRLRLNLGGGSIYCPAN